MTGGYTGKILRVNLTTKTVSSIDTAKYEEYGGGLGMGTAIFWDLAVAPGDWDLQDAFDPRNVCSVMAGPMTATGVPGAGRCSVSGLSPHAFPINWFARTNFGGSFATMLKQAGWDGVVLEGKADKPVWINIINDKVTIEDAKTLWGLDIYQTQEKIYQMVMGVRYKFGDEWGKAGDGFTTNEPSIVSIGPAGEKLARIASLVHGSGSGGGQGGFGGVFGSKNLKAISAIGTGSVKVNDPKAVVDARQLYVTKWPIEGMLGIGQGTASGTAGCSNCVKRCRNRNAINGGESVCADTFWFMKPGGDNLKGAEMIQRLGINAFELHTGPFPMMPGLGYYLNELYKKGVFGPGKKIESYPLQMEKFGTVEWANAFTNTIAYRVGIGNDLAEGAVRFAQKYGRLEEDSTSGLLRYPHWGFLYHWTLPGVEWAFGNILGGRDHNHHDLSNRIGPGSGANAKSWGVEEEVKILADMVIPYQGDPLMFSYGWKLPEAKTNGIYSDHMAKTIAWHRHYGSYWKESMVWCDELFADVFNKKNASHKGATPESEPLFFQAVTGKKTTFADGMEIGRKIWNLKRAIRVLQGRNRDLEKFFKFMYLPGACGQNPQQGALPVYENGNWSYQANADIYLDEPSFEEWKTKYYTLEGWNTGNGWPTRKTLEGVGLKNVADHLQSKGKLGTG